MHTGITTLFVAALLFRLYCKGMHAKARIESGYKYIIESTKDTESIKAALMEATKTMDLLMEVFKSLNVVLIVFNLPISMQLYYKTNMKMKIRMTKLLSSPHYS